MERLIPLAHVLLMPSEMESFGLVALEAMACGVVPVATRVGGVPELITDGEDGFLEPVGDIAGAGGARRRVAARRRAALPDGEDRPVECGGAFLHRQDHSACTSAITSGS